MEFFVIWFPVTILFPKISFSVVILLPGLNIIFPRPNFPSKSFIAFILFFGLNIFLHLLLLLRLFRPNFPLCEFFLLLGPLRFLPVCTLPLFPLFARPHQFLLLLQFLLLPPSHLRHPHHSHHIPTSHPHITSPSNKRSGSRFNIAGLSRTTGSCSSQLGKGLAAKLEDCLEKSQRPLTPPSFLENYVANFL